jgi:hypothetical protein
MSFTKKINDTEYFLGFLENLTDDEIKKLYVNIVNLKFILDFKDKKLKKEIKYNEKHIMCPCCNKVMTNKYFYRHKSSKKYQEYIKKHKV